MEQWLPVPGHDHYEVSDYGRVRSCPRYQRVRGDGRAFFPGKILKPGISGKGHLQVCLNRGQFRLLHQLVLEAFVGPRPPGMLALHRDGDATNNRVENLYWGTYADNLHDSVRHGTHKNAIKTQCKRGHPLDRVALRPDGTVRQRYCSICHNMHGRDWKQRRREAAA